MFSRAGELMKNRIYWIIGGLVHIVGLVHGFTVHVVNDISTMISSKTMCIRVDLDDDERALIKDSLCLSVDIPGIELTEWRTSIAAHVVYVPLFKKNKRLFTESFDAYISMQFDEKNNDTLAACMQGGALIISALTITTFGVNRAASVAVELGTPHGLGYDFSPTSTLLNIVNDDTFTRALEPFGVGTYQDAYHGFSKIQEGARRYDSAELVVLDRMRGLEQELIVDCKRVFSSAYWLYGYIGFLVALIGMFIVLFAHYRRYRSVQKTILRLWLFCLHTFVGATVWMLRDNIGKPYAFCALSFLSFVGACYYLWGNDNSLSSRIFMLIGTLCALLVFPLLVYALLCNNGELISFFMSRF